MRGKCKRRRGSANADAADAEVFVGDGCSQGASFGPMALISRRGQGGRIYNNTRTREPLRRKCVKPAALTTHSPPKTCSRPRTATLPSRALSPPPRSADAHPPTSPPIPRRRPAPVPAQRHALPEHFLTPFPLRRTPAGCADARPPTSPPIPRRRPSPVPATPPYLPFCSASGTKKRHRTVDVRCRMSRSTVVAVGHWGW